MPPPPASSHPHGLCRRLPPAVPAVDKVQFHPRDQRKVFVGLTDGTCQVVHYPAGDHSQVRAPIDVSCRPSTTFRAVRGLCYNPCIAARPVASIDVDCSFDGITLWLLILIDGWTVPHPYSPVSCSPDTRWEAAASARVRTPPLEGPAMTGAWCAPTPPLHPPQTTGARSIPR